MKTKQKWDMDKGNRKHHYIPQWFLKAWGLESNPDQVFRHTKGESKTVIVNVRDVCRVDSLYALPSTTVEASGLVKNWELDLLKNCETVCQKAHSIMQSIDFTKLAKGQPMVEVLDEKLKMPMMVFLFMMKNRSPFEIEKRAKHPYLSAISKMCQDKEPGFMGPESSRNFATNFQLKKLNSDEDALIGMQNLRLFIIDFSRTGVRLPLAVGQYQYSLLTNTPRNIHYCFLTPIGPNKAVMVTSNVSNEDGVYYAASRARSFGCDGYKLFADLTHRCSTNDGNEFFSNHGKQYVGVIDKKHFDFAWPANFNLT